MTNQDVIPTLASLEANIDKLTIGTSLNRTAQQMNVTAKSGHIGGTSGWETTEDDGTVALPASQTASTFVIPINLKVGSTITGFTLHGDVTSGGNVVTVDADLRKLTPTATAYETDASIGAITQVSKTAAYLMAESKSGLSETVVAAASYYIIVTGTTAGGCEALLASVTLTYTEA